MQTFDPNTVAALTTLAIAIAGGGAGLLVHRASRLASPDATGEPSLDQLVQDAPYHRLDNHIRIVD